MSEEASADSASQPETSSITNHGFTGSHFHSHEGVTVYTAGSCSDNGRPTARAGIGVFWGHEDPYNRSERVRRRQASNRAEIYAAEVAIRQAKERGENNLILYTASQFLIDGITKWIHMWKNNGWLTIDGDDVKNCEDFQSLDQAMEGMNIQWMHIRAHQGNEGNDAARRLAKEGAKKP